MKIEGIKTNIISTTNNQKTVAVSLRANKKWFTASVPFGVSPGEREAVQLPVRQALVNIKQIIKPKIIGKNFKNQAEFDDFLLKLDGTENKKNLGCNAILPLSIAFLRALAFENKMPLWQYLAKTTHQQPSLPTPAVLLVEGGKHGKGELSFQEFLLLPEGKTFKEKISLAHKIEINLQKLLFKEGIMKRVIRGAEGAFIPNISEEKALLLIKRAIGKTETKLGIDVAASSFYQNKKYFLNKKIFSSKELNQFYFSLFKNFPFISFLEDPFSENDLASWNSFFYQLPTTNYQLVIVGDDLTTTNEKQIKIAHNGGLCNGVIIKPNQIGSVSETIKSVLLAKKYQWKIIISHRARETKDDFIADLAVGIGADYIKAGGFGQKERLVKYNRLLAIEKEINYNNYE